MQVAAVPGVTRCEDEEVERVLFAGLGGSGKSTLAREVAERLNLPLTVLDDLYYGPGLSLREDFVDAIDAVTGGSRWVIDSQGAPLSSPAPPIHRELMWDRADTVIWLDYPKRVVLARGFNRHLQRVLTRQRLWHGYVETFRDWFDPGHPLRRAWSGHAVRRLQLTERTTDPRWQPLTVVRLRHPRDAAAFLAALSQRT